MDATITNLSSEPVFLPGPKVELDAAGGTNASRVWPNITVADLDSEPVIKTLVLAGTLSVSVAPDAADAAVATQGALSLNSLERYTVANLPTGFDGRVAFATNGRKSGEGAGVGTGQPVCFSNGQWRVLRDDSVVAA